MPHPMPPRQNPAAALALTTRAGPHSRRGRASPVRQARRGRTALPARLGGQPRERISPTRPCRHLRSRLLCPDLEIRVDVCALFVYVQGSCQHRLTHPHVPGGGADVAPSEFVRDMFNGYALTFDESLKALRYQSPELLRQAVDVLLARMPAGDAWADRGHSRAWRVFDGGCGTGLCGPLFRNLTQSLSGVDLSENMVALARKRGVYDELSVGELVAALASWAVRPEAGAGLHGDSAGGAGPGGDVVLAADVLVYFGNLAPFLDTAAKAVRGRRGLVAFTTELLTDDGACDLAAGGAGWKLTTSGRYAHCHAYVAAAAAATGILQVCPQYMMPPI